MGLAPIECIDSQDDFIFVSSNSSYPLVTVVGLSSASGGTLPDVTQLGKVVFSLPDNSHILKVDPVELTKSRPSNP